jgi:hypothetical protein
MIFNEEERSHVAASVIERLRLKGEKPEMTVHILRSGVYWQWALKQEGVKQGLRVHICRL